MAERSVNLALAGVFLLAGLGSSQGQASDSRTVEEAVLTASAGMERAAGAVDAERLFTFMLDTDKGSVIQNGVFLATREDALRQVQNDLRGISKIEYRWRRRHVTVLAADVALLTAEGESIATTADDRVFTTPFAQTVVFVRSAGQWKVLHAHQSSPLVR